MFYRLLQTLAVGCLLTLAFCLSMSAQTPAPIGKSYGSLDIPRPAKTVPQYPSPVTFTDFSAASGINFKHVASITSVKYLPETTGGWLSRKAPRLENPEIDRNHQIQEK